MVSKTYPLEPFNTEILIPKNQNSMTLEEAQTFIESIKKGATKKDEIKVYDRFLHILTQLKARNLSKEETQSIEMELKFLNIKSNPKNRKKYIKQALNSFEKYLRDKFSLTLKGYYTRMGLFLGTCFGILFGITFLSSLERSVGLSLGMSAGLLIGLLLGRRMDAKAEKDDRVL